MKYEDYEQQLSNLFAARHLLREVWGKSGDSPFGLIEDPELLPELLHEATLIVERESFAELPINDTFELLIRVFRMFLSGNGGPINEDTKVVVDRGFELIDQTILQFLQMLANGAVTMPEQKAA